MKTVTRAIEVDVPASVAYDTWSRFELFPHFMKDVESVVQGRDERHLHWRARLWGKIEEWDAVVTEQIPDKRIAWHSLQGAKNAGVVTFHRLTDDRTRVMLQMDYEPEGVVENVGDFLGLMSGRTEGDLERFKEFVEQRGVETGAWRGKVPGKDDTSY